MIGVCGKCELTDQQCTFGSLFFWYSKKKTNKIGNRKYDHGTIEESLTKR